MEIRMMGITNVLLGLILLTLLFPAVQAQDDIWKAASMGKIDVVKHHLANGIDINAKDPIVGLTPLSGATLTGQTEMVEFLIQQGADVNAKNKDGGTALHGAAFLGRSKEAELLISNGADTKVRDGDGSTAMDNLQVDWPTTQFIVQLLQITVDQENVEAGRAKIAEIIKPSESKVKEVKLGKKAQPRDELSIKMITSAKKLALDDIFPTDHVLDVKITVDEKDWDTIRYQSRNFVSALHESRKYAPPDSPYTYVDASVSIDGVEFPLVGIRKKGFIGSLSSTRPSLKIKLNHIEKNARIEGLTNLTFNNNQQDVSLISQFMSYALFNAAGSPAPRCAYAKLTVNGNSLGIYSHVETMRKPLLKRAFGNDDGILYEGTVVDFYPDWEGSFERKSGKDELGRQKILQLIKVLEGEDENIESAIGRLVDLDSFYTFWAMEGLLSFWDGYSGNSNNFFVYLNPETDKFHFMPWGADSLFERYSPIRDDRKDPVSVKTKGLIAHKLYQLESGRRRYEQSLRTIIEQHWDEDALLAETERIEALVKPHLDIGNGTEADFAITEVRGWVEWARTASPEEREGAINSEKFRLLSPKAQEAITEGIEKLKTEEGKDKLSGKEDRGEPDKYDEEDEEKRQVEQLVYRFAGSLEERRRFIRQRRADITEEIANGMPKWEAKPDKPFVIGGSDNISDAAREGNFEAVKRHLDKGANINAPHGLFQMTPLTSATIWGQVRMVEFLLQQGADANARNNDGGTALHGAAFLGLDELAALLIQNGADINARNNDGATVMNTLMLDWGTTEFIAGMIQLKLDREEVETGRAKMVELLRQ